MPPKKKKDTSVVVLDTGIAPRTLRNRSIEMGAPLNQAELADLIRTVVREENQAGVPVLREMMREEIRTVVGKFQSDLEAIQTDMAECKAKSNVVDDTLTSIDSRITALETSNCALVKENQKLKDNIQSLERHSRKFNLRVFGLHSGIEKGNPTAFMTTFFSEMFQPSELPGAPAVENAHRVGEVKLDSAGKPLGRPMIFRMQRFQVKQAIINISKDRGVMNYRGMKVRIFPDFTSEESAKRAKFSDLRQKLYEAKIRSGFRQPATLLITFNEVTKSFTDADKAEEYYRSDIEPNLGPG